jgi:phosphatidyl-myo-inositol dimannoside synthase
LILTVQTTTFTGFGGIPTYNRLVCRVLNERSKTSGDYVLVATDELKDIEREAAKLPELRLQGFAGNRVGMIKRLLSLGLSKKFDLALIGHVNYAPLGLLLKLLQPRLRYGVMLYGIEAWQRLPRLRALALRQADFMISISDYTKQRAVETNGLSADRIHLLANALEWDDRTGPDIDSQESVPTKSFSSSGHQATDRVNMLSVCRLDQYERYKGVDKIIEVLGQVSQSVPDVHYTVIGDGTDLERHKELARRLGVSDRVSFPGFVDDETLRDCYRDCDLFVLPSAGEGFGFVFLEAMRFSKAVVAADSGGAPEVVENNVTGRLVEYGQQQELAETLIDLLLDPERCEQMGQAGYQKLQEKFTFPHFKETFTEILRLELPPGKAGNARFASLNANPNS